jgi:hypothetical protein
MKSRLIKCSSQLRSSGNNGRWVINLPSQAGQIDNVKKMCTRYIQFPNQITNINENNNTINFYRRRAGDIFDFYSRQIPVGQYTITELLPLLTTALTTVIGGSLVVTATYNTTTNRIELTATGTTFDYIRLTAGPTPGTYTQSPIDPIIGNNTNDIILEGAGAVSLNLPPNLTGLSTVYLHCRTVAAGNCILPNLNISMFDIIDISNTPYGAVATLDIDTPDIHTLFYEDEIPRNFKFLEFTMRDTAGNVVTVPENFNVEVYLKVFY